MKREEILNQIIEEQQKVIENLKQSVDRYKTASDLDENDISDPDDLARQTEAKDMQLRYEKMLNDAKQNLSFILGEKNTAHTEIENGSVIITDKMVLFVGVSVPKFKFDKTDVVSFSNDTPIFAKIKGKKIGDHFELGNGTYVIKEIL